MKLTETEKSEGIVHNLGSRACACLVTKAVTLMLALDGAANTTAPLAVIDTNDWENSRLAALMAAWLYCSSVRARLRMASDAMLAVW